jgi:hypothetical protein
MVYPAWWQGNEEIKKEQAKKKSSTLYVADPAKAKVHKKNLARYAEDSLDARLRQVKENVMGNNQSGEEENIIQIEQ